jgi:hypothetical protein
MALAKASASLLSARSSASSTRCSMGEWTGSQSIMARWIPVMM